MCRVGGVCESDVPPRSFVEYLHEVSSRGQDPCEWVFFFSSHPPTTHIYITLRHTSFSSRQMRFIWAVHEATPVECGIISFCKMMLELIGLTTCLNIMIYTGMHAYQYWYSLLSGNSASCHTFYSIANFIRFDHFTFTFKTSMKQRKCKNVNVQKHTIVFTNKYCMYI